MEEIRKKYLLNYEDIKNILFIILFWVPKEEINIIDDEGIKSKINLKDILCSVNKKIISVKYFIEDIVMKKTFHEMNNFFYDNIKIISLYFHYCELSNR